MRKYLTILLLSTILIARTQDTTISDRVYDLWEDYDDEYFNGSISQAEPKGYKMNRASTLNEVMLWAIGEGKTDLANNCLSELNSIFGTSYDLPSVSYQLSTVFDGDSIRLQDMTDYVTQVFDSTGILAILATSPTVTTTGSPVANQIAVLSGSGTITGFTDLAYTSDSTSISNDLYLGDSLTFGGQKIGQWSDVASTVANLTDSTLTLWNSSGDTIKLQLDTVYMDSTVIKPLGIYFRDGSFVDSTISINNVIYNDTLRFNNQNWVMFGNDSAAVYNTSWTWIGNIW